MKTILLFIWLGLSLLNCKTTNTQTLKTKNKTSIEDVKFEKLWAKINNTTWLKTYSSENRMASSEVLYTTTYFVFYEDANGNKKCLKQFFGIENHRSNRLFNLDDFSHLDVFKEFRITDTGEVIGRLKSLSLFEEKAIVLKEGGGYIDIERVKKDSSILEPLHTDAVTIEMKFEKLWAKINNTTWARSNTFPGVGGYYTFYEDVYGRKRCLKQTSGSGARVTGSSLYSYSSFSYLKVFKEFQITDTGKIESKNLYLFEDKAVILNHGGRSFDIEKIKKDPSILFRKI